MNNMIKQILDADKAARMRVDAANKSKYDVQATIQNKKDQMKEMYESKAKADVLKKQEAIKLESDEEVKAIKDRFEASVKALEEMFQTRKEGWINDIVKRCLESE